jgi:myosin heavy chain 9/10/11/14
MARTATEYTNMIKKKEDDMSRLTSELDKSKLERGNLLKEITEMQGKIDTLTSELQAQQQDGKRSADARARLQEEMDELRRLLQAKVTEETRRSEVDKSKEMELADLRAQVSKLSQDLSNARKQALEGQSKLKVELDTLLREHQMLEQSHKSLSDREASNQSKLKEAEALLSDAAKAKRTLESDLQSVRSRQIDLESQLAGALKEKDASVFTANICC